MRLRPLFVVVAAITVTLVVLLLGATVAAAPARGEPETLVQPTGESFRATLHGDEWFNWVATESGAIIARGGGGFWYYAVVADGRLKPGTARYAIDRPPLGALSGSRISALLRSGVLAPDLDQRRARALLRLPTTGPSGPEKVLLVLVQFADTSLTYSSESSWSNLIFGSTGSTVGAYYREVSRQNFYFTPAEESWGTANDGVVKVSLPYNHPNTANDTGEANRTIVKDALTAADPYVNFAAFDTNGNSGLSTSELHIVTVVAGYEASCSSYAPSVWGHRWSLATTLTLDGKWLCSWAYGGGYTQQGERHGDHMATIGILCHELGHDVGLPDLYDYDYSSRGVGIHSLMAYGIWAFIAGADAGSCPTHLDAWSKQALGFVVPVVAVSGDYTLNGTGPDTSYSVVKVPTANPKQYFLVENRQFSGFDASLADRCWAGGLLILHVDEDVIAACGHRVNDNEHHKGVDVEEANEGALGYSQLDEGYRSGYDHYYYVDGYTTFGPSTIPSSDIYIGADDADGFPDYAPSYITITATSASGTAMTVRVSRGPTIVSTSPARNDLAAPITSTITATFSEDIQPGTLSARVLDAALNDVPIQSRTVSGRTLTISLVNPLAVQAVYAVMIDAGAVKSMTGVPSEADLWGFATQGLGQPTLLYPSNNAPNVPTALTLQWGQVTYATSYTVQVATNSSFSGPIVNQSTSGLSMPVNLQPGTLYYWRVQAAADQTVGPWSDVLLFTTAGDPPPPPPPVLVAPGDGATGVLTTPELKWNASPEATSYVVEVAADSGFGDVRFTETLGGVSTTVSPALQNAKQHWWHVKAVNAGGSSAWSTRTFTTIVAPPPAPVLVAPGDGATGVLTTPELKWNASPGATSYVVEVAADSGFGDVRFTQTLAGTSTTVSPALQNVKQHWWHVKAVNVGGSSAWSTRTFTTIVAPPPPPVLLAPGDGTTGVPTRPTLSWTATAGATYSVQLAADPAFTSVRFTRANLTAASVAVSPALPNSTRFWWRVRLTNSTGTSGWSAAHAFETVVLPPPPPGLLTPLNGAAGVSTTPLLTWAAAPGATSYRVQVATNAGFTALRFDQSGVETTSVTVTPALPTGTKCWWRVSASNAAGPGAWSAARGFTTVKAPSPPKLRYPAQNAKQVPLSPTLTWSASLGAASYQVQVASNAAFTAIVSDQAGIASTSVTVDLTLAYGTKYWWRVNATNAIGTTNWSAARYFTTAVAKPAAPVLLSPANGLTGVTTKPRLTWLAAARASSYTVQVAKDPGFAQVVFTKAGIRPCVIQVSRGLTRGRQYYWRVCGVNASGAGGWSETRTFTTAGTLSASESARPGAGAVRAGGWLL